MATVEVFLVDEGPLQFQISKPDERLKLILPEAGIEEVDINPESLIFEIDEEEAMRLYTWMREHYERKVEKARKARYVDVDVPMIDEEP